jgi:tRNA G18 (ribose-2'-O)-methylase SpoU
MNKDRQLILIVHNVRSSHNVGSMLRTCDGLGINKVFLTGYTPYPQLENDTRLPYLARRVDNQIHKTALGAEKNVPWEHKDNLWPLLNELRAQDFQISALEQSPSAVPINSYTPPPNLAIIVGREVEGIEDDILASVDLIIEIPMKGAKESFNVSVAAAIALYHCQNTYLSSKT